MNAPVRIPQPVAFALGDRTEGKPAGRARERRKDRVLPILIVGSLIVHLLIFLPSLLSHDAERPPAPREIPVEVVQEPPAQKPPPQAAPAPKTDVAKPQQKPAPQKPPSERPKSEAEKPPAKAAREKPAEPPGPSGGEQRLKDLLGPMPAVALPGAAADGTDEVAYEQLVLSKVSKAKKEGRFQGRPADASVSFHIDEAGTVTSVTLIRPSGEKFVDDEAVAMVHRGEPYPPPPPGGRRDYMITLRFMAMP